MYSGAVRLCFGLPANVYDAGICFGGSLLRAMPGAKRARRDSPSLPFIRASRAARGSVRIVKERVSGLEIGESSDDFRINPYYWAVVRFDYEERKRRET